MEGVTWQQQQGLVGGEGEEGKSIQEMAEAPSGRKRTVVAAA